MKPFEQQKSCTISSLGEVELIQRLGNWLGKVSPQAPEGMGDDCAVLICEANKKQLLTTDSLTYGQHFDESVQALDAGAKLIKRNLSDIAAMGGTPDRALLNLLCGPKLSIAWLEAFVEGIRQTCEQYEVKLVGGDISALQGDQFSAVLTQTGYTTNPILRSGTSEGDTIYVTGTLGGSMLKKHYTFEPRLAEGRWLAESGACSAMMDLTDGLAKDLPTFVPNKCSAWLDLPAIPVSVDAKQLGGDPIQHAFCDGEDYELLFTVKQNQNLEEFEQSWQKKFPDVELAKIGRIGTEMDNAACIDASNQKALPWQKGFEHLSQK